MTLGFFILFTIIFSIEEDDTFINTLKISSVLSVLFLASYLLTFDLIYLFFFKKKPKPTIYHFIFNIIVGYSILALFVLISYDFKL